MTNISETIAALRKEAGETQNALAEALGVSNRTVSKWENAESEPEASMLSALADHFGTTVDALLGRAPKIPDPYEGIESYDGAALKYFEESKAVLDRLRDCYGRIFDLEMQGETEEERGPNTLSAPAFPWPGENGWHPDAAVSRICSSPVYSALTAGREVNLILSLFPNEDGYGWLERDAERIAAVLKLFSDPRALKLIKKMHEPEFPEKFTLGYAAQIAGMPEEALEPLLDLLVENPETVELREGTVRFYSWWYGNARILAALSLFYLEFVCGNETGVNCFNSVFRTAKAAGGKEERA